MPAETPADADPRLRCTSIGVDREHARHWKNNTYVYAVISRRSRGLSIGINLNPDQACNFNCVYCQVDRSNPGRAPYAAMRTLDLTAVERELDTILAATADGSLYADAPFSALPPDQRGVRDLAFSGDGEPTQSPVLIDAVRLAAAARRRFALADARLVLITNASHLREPRVREALRLLDADGGEVWAKLDAGTEDYFRTVNRPRAAGLVTLASILDNIADAARVRPIVIQSLWMRLHGAPPPPEEIEAYCARIGELVAGGGRIARLQLYTIARRTAEDYAAPLTDAELDEVGRLVRSRTGAVVELFHGI